MSRATPPTPLDDARALLALSRLIYRYRLQARANGVQPAARAVRELEPLGRALAAAVEAAELAEEGDERTRALAEVARLGERLWSLVDDKWESIRSLVGVLMAGIREERRPAGGPPPRLGQ